jgi:hypothetical protein
MPGRQIGALVIEKMLWIRIRTRRAKKPVEDGSEPRLVYR